MRVADFVVQQLARAGIEHVFTVCGGGAIFLCDALAKEAKAGRMKYIACHHEQAAAIAAEAYARARSRLGAAFVTSGPGGTNAITGVAGAWTDNIPTITISGQTFLEQTIRGHAGLRTMGVQEINIVDMVKPITKYAVMIDDPEMVPYHLARALYLAENGRPGPVWLDIPADIQNAQVDEGKLVSWEPAWPQAPEFRGAVETLPLKVEQLVEMLKASDRPLLHVGQGVRIADAMPELFEFLRLMHVPVVTARNGNDLIPSDHELYVGRPGTFAQRGANFAVQTCDLYLAIGTRLSLAQTGYNAKDYARGAKVVMVDIDRAELDKDTVRIDLKIHAHAQDFLQELNRQVLGAKWEWPSWQARCKRWRERYPVMRSEYREPSPYVNSYHLVDELSAVADPSDVIVTDMGFAFQNTHQGWKVKAGQRLMTNGGLAPMGWGLPAAIGAAIGTGRRVLCIAGDGGLMMNVQELATLAHHRLPVKIFLLNNGGYLTMRQSQRHAFDSYMGSDESSGISFPDFALLAAAHRIRYVRSTGNESTRAMIRAALREDGPVICEVMMDPDQLQAPKSINRRLPDGTIKQTSIEDAFPFLPEAELRENLTIEEEK